MPELTERRFYRFGRFRLDPNGRVLFRGDRAVRLPPKAADILLVLVQNAGSVVEKKDLLKHVWQDAFVEEGSLTRTISILRKALEDPSREQELITTIAKRGYRFAAPVMESPERPARAATERLMMVVLPFENLGSDESHLWAESYQRNLGDMLTLQFEVAKAVAKEIQIKLAPQERERLSSAGTVNPQAYEAYLKGRYLLNRRTLETLQKSVQYFKK